MKYFEVNEPYYALIKAQSKKQAMEIYTKKVSEDNEGTLKEEMMEVNRDYALVKFDRSPGEDGQLIPIIEIIETFNKDKAELLVIDGSLL
ncbi:hypothetical protein M3612_16625 [Niallia taxi]|uniref:hypothetical protein n=1 Tax=Niallia taxi TaxID=2499688 RepID=UPI00203E2AD8|nr:hypothetical protein [Niallia taxi]MCM3216125.1 hypothetical protein [Niallia taxi]